MSRFAFLFLWLAACAPTPAAITVVPTRGEQIALDTGFFPDPDVHVGTVEAEVPASRLGSTCAGSIAREPTYELVSSTGFSELHVVVHSDSDTTLVVQRPDGSVACADDVVGLDPEIETAIDPGTTRIWVGTYERAAHYRLALSELEDAPRIASEHAAALLDEPLGTLEEASRDIATLF